MILDHCHRASCVQIIEALRAKVEELSKERDSLSSVVRDDYVELKGLQVEAAAKDAVIERLREALEFGTDLYDDTKNQRDLSMALYEWVNTARIALAIPNDSSALEARLTQEREKCREAVRDGSSEGDYYADRIEVMK